MRCCIGAFLWGFILSFSLPRRMNASVLAMSRRSNYRDFCSSRTAHSSWRRSRCMYYNLSIVFRHERLECFGRGSRSVRVQWPLLACLAPLLSSTLVSLPRDCRQLIGERYRALPFLFNPKRSRASSVALTAFTDLLSGQSTNEQENNTIWLKKVRRFPLLLGPHGLTLRDHGTADTAQSQRSAILSKLFLLASCC